jgi:hypothetical protein
VYVRMQSTGGLRRGRPAKPQALTVSLHWAIRFTSLLIWRVFALRKQYTVSAACIERKEYFPH